MRRAVPLVLVVACGHGGGMPDEDLGGLVISPKEAPEAIDVDRATKDPAELGRALALRERDVIAAIGMHVLATNSDVSVTEGGKVVSDLGDHATLEFLNAATKDIDLSVKGDVDFRNSNDVLIRISSAIPIFDTTTSIQDCLRRIEIVPVETTLASPIEELDFQGNLFANNWKFGLKEKGTSSVAAIANPLTREFHFCTGTTPQGEAFNIGVHPRPQPTPARPRKRARR